jgi:hypothetical protein
MYLLHCMSPLMALNGRPGIDQICPLLKVDRPCHRVAGTCQSGPTSDIPRGLHRMEPSCRVKSQFDRMPAMAADLIGPEQTGLLFYARMLYFARAPFRGDADPGAEE